MKLKIQIENLKIKTLKMIEDAAKKGDTRTILSTTKIVEEAEKLTKRWDEIKSAYDVLEATVNLTEIPSYLIKKEPSSIKINELSPKKKGKARRNAFVQELKTIGISLINVGGTTYKTKTENLVGIAYASERKSNRWFLGLPSKGYSSVTLICENKSGELFNFVLPKDFLNSNSNKLSRDENGNFKFNIFLKGESYKLRIPGEGYENIDSFKGNYSPLSL